MMSLDETYHNQPWVDRTKVKVLQATLMTATVLALFLAVENLVQNPRDWSRILYSHAPILLLLVGGIALIQRGAYHRIVSPLMIFLSLALTLPALSSGLSPVPEMFLLGFGRYYPALTLAAALFAGYRTLITSATIGLGWCWIYHLLYLQELQGVRKELAWSALMEGTVLHLIIAIIGVGSLYLSRQALNRLQQELKENSDLRASLEDNIRKRTAELEIARQEAEMASKAKSAFLANMSHEIRTPFNCVLGMTDLLAHTPLSQEQLEYVNLIQESGHHLLSLLQDILDWSKIEAERMELDIAPFALDDMLGLVLQLQTPIANKKGLVLRLQSDPNSPDILVGDRQRLVQILMNLVGNAIKFTERGEVCLQLQKTDDNTLHFSVSDTGIGMDANTLVRVFERFQQADGSTTRQFGGTGLGLSISRALVELMGGTLQVESAPGQGSRFSFAISLLNAQLYSSALPAR